MIKGHVSCVINKKPRQPKGLPGLFHSTIFLSNRADPKGDAPNPIRFDKGA